MNSDQDRTDPQPIDVSWRAFSIFATLLFVGTFAYCWWRSSKASMVFVASWAIICLVGLAIRLVRRRHNGPS